jgi:hypothetical protein
LFGVAQPIAPREDLLPDFALAGNGYRVMVVERRSAKFCALLITHRPSRSYLSSRAAERDVLFSELAGGRLGRSESM